MNEPHSLLICFLFFAKEPRPNCILKNMSGTGINLALLLEFNKQTNYLVGGFNPSENISQIGSLPFFGGVKKEIFETTT